jgi:hypothetical protein
LPGVLAHTIHGGRQIVARRGSKPAAARVATSIECEYLHISHNRAQQGSPYWSIRISG